MRLTPDAAAGPPAQPDRRFLPASAAGERPCRLCGRALTALQRIRGDLCDAMDCRRRATDARRQAERDAMLDAVRQGAATRWAMPQLLHAPVVWLADHDKALTPVTLAELAEQRAYLIALGCAAEGPDPMPDADDGPVDDVDPDHAPRGATAGHRLCALCSGRCCRTGAQQYAYLRGAPLRRWLSRHTGANWAEAVEHYMRMVPEQHVGGSCLHHGERGCTLPREMRSDICNDFACAALERVQALAAADPGVVVVAGIVRHHGLHDAALVSAQALRALPAGTEEPVRDADVATVESGPFDIEND